MHFQLWETVFGMLSRHFQVKIMSIYGDIREIVFVTCHVLLRDRRRSTAILSICTSSVVDIFQFSP